MVLEAWRFCGCQWRPETALLAAAFYGFSDIDFLFEQLLAVRSTIEKWQEAQRRADAQRR